MDECFYWEKEIGSISVKGNSVKKIREIRNKLSNEEIDLDEVNKIGATQD